MFAGILPHHTRISIHALLAESDLFESGFLFNLLFYFYPRSPCGERPPPYNLMIHHTHISIHALLAESDHPQTSGHPHNTKFLSTLSLRRATAVKISCAWSESISIHALLAESDAKNTSIAGRITLFLSTLSLRRATFARTLNALNGLFLSTLSLRRAT